MISIHTADVSSTVCLTACDSQQVFAVLTNVRTAPLGEWKEAEHTLATHQEYYYGFPKNNPDSFFREQ